MYNDEPWGVQIQVVAFTKSFPGPVLLVNIPNKQF